MEVNLNFQPGSDPSLEGRFFFFKVNRMEEDKHGKFLNGTGQDIILFWPGDAYYALALSKFSGKPLSGLLQQFSEKQNWNEINRELGITPGSEKFKLFKEWVDEISVYPQ